MLIVTLGLVVFALLTLWLLHRWHQHWQAAETRAELLLRHLLSPGEQEQLARRGYLEVPSPSLPYRCYRIPRYPGRVQVYEHAAPVMGLCVQATEPLPEGDVVVLHKLMIEGNEAEYLSLANRFYP